MYGCDFCAQDPSFAGFGGFWDAIKRAAAWVKQNLLTGHVPPVTYQPPIVVGQPGPGDIGSFLTSPTGLLAAGAVLLLLMQRRN